MAENLLCFGDNADFLRDKELCPDESVDLIYLDPPFKEGKKRRRRDGKQLELGR